jgi:membrane fusion protein (multidrug efflux system)
MRILGSLFSSFSIVILLLAVPGCKQEKPGIQSQSTTPRAVQVKAITVEPRLLEHKITSTGSLLANEEVEIRPETAGRIMAINFDEGSFVSKGTLLVKIDDSELQAQLKKLLLEEQLAKDDVYRKQKLLEIKAATEEEFQIAQNQLGVIQAEIELVRSQLAKTEIYAPFSGYIGLRYASAGGYATPSLVVARMQQTDPIKIEFTVPEKYIEYLRKGSPVNFTVAGSENVFTGTIYAIEPKIDVQTRSFTVRAKCPNPGNRLVPGAFVKVEIILERVSDALVIPSEAVIPDIRGEKVFLCDQGKVSIRYVVTGIRTDYEVQVTEGLVPHDTVITTGLLQLREGMKVNVLMQDSM